MSQGLVVWATVLTFVVVFALVYGALEGWTRKGRR